MSKPPTASLPLLRDIPQGCSLQKSSEGQRFTCVRVGEAIHVLADRCPHQGYPLSQGHVREGVLTCAWHNWKFEVDSGESLFGGEGIRRYPSEIEDGRVVVDLSFDAEAEAERLTTSMTRALGNGDSGALLRDGLRLGALAPSDEPATHGRVGPAFGLMAALAAERVPYGFDHPLATLADLASWIARGWLPDAHGLAVAATMFAESHRYLSPRPVPEPVADWAGLCADLREERRGEAEAKARAAARGGALEPLIRTQLLPFLGDHLYAYGHGAIYTRKTQQLVAAFPSASEVLCAALTVRLAWSTAETSLPPWAATRAGYLAVEGLTPGQGALDDRPGYEEAVLESEKTAVAATVAALSRGVAARALVFASAHAAAVRLSRFDPKWETDLDAEVTVLDVSHALTFAEGVLALLEHASARDTMRLTVQAAAFVGKLHKADRPPSAGVDAPTLSEASLAEAIAARDPSMATLARRLDTDARLASYPQLAAFAASDVFVRPIFIAHAIKLSEACYQLESLDPATDHAYLEATLTLLLPRRPERTPAREAKLAERVLQDGRPPRGVY